MNKPKIIFENQEFLVLDKPAGWVVTFVESAKNSPILETWLKENFDYEIAKTKEFRSGIVHRLDKETSGCMVVAKTRESFKDLQKQFKERSVEKTYLALVHGEVFPKEGEIDAPLGRLPWRKDRFGVLAGGRPSKTKYKVLDFYKKGEDEHTLVEAYPKTGRTHQIRIHFKYLGFPIVSDEFYAGRKTARDDRKWCPRLFLHASKISFLDSKNDKRVDFEAKLHRDLEKSLKVIEKVRENS